LRPAIPPWPGSGRTSRRRSARSSWNSPIIGWSALTIPHRATSTATALEPVEIVAFDGAALRGLLRSDCRFATTVYPRLLQAVSRRLIATREQLLDLFAAQGEAAW
jgi:CRP/FNR family cyclic AMP-dependent transcriptional regulator